MAFQEEFCSVERRRRKKITEKPEFRQVIIRRKKKPVENRQEPIDQVTLSVIPIDESLPAQDELLSEQMMADYEDLTDRTLAWLAETMNWSLRWIRRNEIYRKRVLYMLEVIDQEVMHGLCVPINKDAASFKEMYIDVDEFIRRLESRGIRVSSRPEDDMVKEITRIIEDERLMRIVPLLR